MNQPAMWSLASSAMRLVWPLASDDAAFETV